MTRFALLTVLFTLTSGAAGRSMAEEREPGLARAKMDAGGRALDAGDARTAARLFQEAYALDPQPRFLYTLGVAYEGAGDAIQAAECFERFLEAAHDASPRHREDARRQLDKLRARLARLRLDAAPGTAVLVDGQLRGQAPLPHALWLAPGRHGLRAERREQDPIEREVLLAPGELFTWTVQQQLSPRPPTLDQPAGTLATSRVPPPPSVPELPRPLYRRPSFLVGAGAVVAGAVITAILLSSRADGASCVKDTPCLER